MSDDMVLKSIRSGGVNGSSLNLRMVNVEPLVEISGQRMSITTYAASQPDVERLEQLIGRELDFIYPGCRPLQQAQFAVVADYAQQAMEVVARRLELAGHDVQWRVVGPNRFVVSGPRLDTDLRWMWERRGLFEVRLLSGDIDVGHALIMKENLAESIALCCRYGKLFHTHWNDTSLLCC